MRGFSGLGQGAMGRLEARFQEIRRAFFPRWDRARQWRVLSGTRSGPPAVSGFCQRREKTIYVNEPADGDLNLVLVHEICHAVTVDKHGPRWRARMRRAAERATELRMPSLARRIADEGATYGIMVPNRLG